jgi:hypothetical protein
MGIPIDPTKLKLKYELKVHRKTKSWPDAEGVLYEVARYLEHQDTNIVKKQKLSEIVSDGEKLDMIIQSLCKKKFIEQVDESNFQLLKHGWE